MVDIETDGNDPRKGGGLLCVGRVWDDQPGRSPMVTREVTAEAARLLADDRCATVCHSNYDVVYLRRMGYEVNGPVFNTIVMAWILNENQPLDLDSLAMKYCSERMDKRIVRTSGKVLFKTRSKALVPLAEAPWPELRRYNAGDVSATANLFRTLRTRMQTTEGGRWWNYFLAEEVDFTKLLITMELAGIPINLDDARAMEVRLEAENDRQRTVLDKLMGYPVMWSSPDKLRKVLFDKFWFETSRCAITPEQRTALLAGEEGSWPPAGFEVTKVGRLYAHGYWTRKGLGLKPTPADQKTKKKLPQVTRPALVEWHGDNELVQEYLAWKKVDKLLGTYLRVYPERSYNDRLYGRFAQTGTKTGRLSSSGPNLQNQPTRGELGKAVRGLFQGRLIVGDYSQLEPRLMAHFSGDSVLSGAYTSGQDVYLITARGLGFGDISKDDPRRELSKTVFLGTQYGAGPGKLKTILAGSGFKATMAECRGYINALEATYPRLYEWKEEVIDEAYTNGFVRTLSGRKRRLKRTLEGGDNWKQAGGERQAVNAVVQGSAGDVVRRCMVDVAGAFPYLDTLAQVHDEVIWEAQPHVRAGSMHNILVALRHSMENNHGFDLRVPLVFEPVVCNTWADKGVEGLEWPEEDE